MYPQRMRTTVTLDDDVVAAIEGVRRSDGLGLSEAVNTLIRSGLGAQPKRRQWEPPTPVNIGLRIDVTNVAEAIEQLDGPNSR
jgi:hypothetical protein